MAVAAGFEPAVGGYPTNAFEAFTFGRSDTPPPIRIEQTVACLQIWGGHGRINGESGAVLQIGTQNEVLPISWTEKSVSD